MRETKPAPIFFQPSMLRNPIYPLVVAKRLVNRTATQPTEAAVVRSVHSKPDK